MLSTTMVEILDTREQVSLPWMMYNVLVKRLISQDALGLVQISRTANIRKMLVLFAWNQALTMVMVLWMTMSQWVTSDFGSIMSIHRTLKVLHMKDFLNSMMKASQDGELSVTTISQLMI